MNCVAPDGQQGTNSGYQNHKCRCTDCRGAHARHQAQYRARQARKAA